MTDPRKGSILGALMAEARPLPRTAPALHTVSSTSGVLGQPVATTLAQKGVISRKGRKDYVAPPRSQNGSIKAAPKGTLTRQAADWLASVTGDDAAAYRRAHKIADVSDMVNPISWATNLGHSARQLYESPSVQTGVDTALSALDFAGPVAKGAGVLAGAAMPALKKAARRAATLDDFGPNSIKSINDHDNWSILTAQNPMGKQATPEFNAERMAALKADLDGEGLQYIDGGVGKYGNNEDVLTVLGIDEKRARELGKKYEQDSVLTNKGLIYHDGSIHPSRGVNTFDEDPEDFYTKLPNGSRFAVDIDFDNLIPAPAPKPANRASVINEYAANGGGQHKGSLHSAYSTVKMDRSHADQTATYNQTHELSQAPIMRPEDLSGHIVPLVGDRTDIGKQLASVNGRNLNQPLDLEGGARYPHIQADLGQEAAWASGLSVTKAITNNARKLSDKGDVTGVYSAMGPRSSDFSTMMADAALRQMPESPVSRKALEDFDDLIRQSHPKWVGIADAKNRELAQAQLRNKSGLRMDFVKEMDGAGPQSQGFPSIGATRYAVTDPVLRHVPEGTSGLTMSKLDAGASPILDPAIPHTTYPTQVKGAFSGGFEVPPAREDVFPDFFAGRRAMGIAPGGDRRSFEISSVNQPVNQQWIDRLSQIIEQKKAEGARW